MIWIKDLANQILFIAFLVSCIATFGSIALLIIKKWVIPRRKVHEKKYITLTDVEYTIR